MAWYQTGAASGASGQKVVTGSGGAAFNGNVQPGDAFRITSTGWSSEIVTVDSNTQITLRDNLPSTLSANGYSIHPTVARDVELTAEVQALITEFQGVVDESGAGMFAEGSVGAPSVRGTTDQNTGVNLPGSGVIQFVTEGVERISVAADGQVGIKGQTLFGYGVDGAISLYRAYAASHATGNRGDDLNLVITEGGTTSGVKVQNVASAVGGYNSVRVVLSGQEGGATTATDILIAGPTSGAGVRGVPLTGKALTVYTENAAVAEAGLAIIGRQFGYGAGIEAQSGMATSGALKVMGKLVWDGANTWDSADVGTQDAMARVYVTLNGTLTEGFRITEKGRIVAGVAATTDYHLLRGNAGDPEGTNIVSIDRNGTYPSLVVFGVSDSSYNTAAAAVWIGKNSITGRGANVAGTVNASGADIAETKRRALLCGTILKGRVCGMDANGELVTAWAEAVQFRVKATDPALVMGDRWGTPQAIGLPHPGNKPTFQAPERTSPPAYTGRVEPVEGVDPLYSLTIVAWASERDAHQAALAAHAAAQTTMWADAKADHAEAVAAYEATKAAWDTAYEAARQRIDRIAYCGTVPLVITGPVEAGQYVIAQQDGDGIRAVCVPNYDDDTRCLVIGRVEAANPSEARWRALINPDIPLDPEWNAIVDVMRL